MQPGKLLHFSGTISGENASVNAAVTLANLGFSISMQSDTNPVLSGEPFEVTYHTKGADGQPVGEKITVTVAHRRDSGSLPPVLSDFPWSTIQQFPRFTEVIVQEHSLQILRRAPARFS